MAKAVLADISGKHDYSTTAFSAPEDLEHGQAVLGSFACGMAEHWAIFDKKKSAFIEFSRQDGKGMILERPFDEWMERWKHGNPRKVTWTNIAAYGGAVVERARRKIGIEVNYALLARSNDPRYQNCEAFARWCHWKMSRSAQASVPLKILTSFFFLLVIVVLVMGWVYGLWGATFPLGFVFSLPLTYRYLLPFLIHVLNVILQPTVGSTST